jgi:hypothetical protein
VGKTRGQRSKENFGREIEGTRTFQIWLVSWYSMGTEPPTEPPSDSVGAPNKNLVFHKMSLSVRGEARRGERADGGVHVGFFFSHSLMSKLSL